MNIKMKTCYKYTILWVTLAFCVLWSVNSISYAKELPKEKTLELFSNISDNVKINTDWSIVFWNEVIKWNIKYNIKKTAVNGDMKQEWSLDGNILWLDIDVSLWYEILKKWKWLFFKLEKLDISNNEKWNLLADQKVFDLVKFFQNSWYIWINLEDILLKLEEKNNVWIVKKENYVSLKSTITNLIELKGISSINQTLLADLIKNDILKIDFDWNKYKLVFDINEKNYAKVIDNFLKVLEITTRFDEEQKENISYLRKNITYLRSQEDIKKLIYLDDILNKIDNEIVIENDNIKNIKINIENKDVIEVLSSLLKHKIINKEQKKEFDSIFLKMNIDTKIEKTNEVIEEVKESKDITELVNFNLYKEKNITKKGKYFYINNLHKVEQEKWLEIMWMSNKIFTNILEKGKYNNMNDNDKIVFLWKLENKIGWLLKKSNKAEINNFYIYCILDRIIVEKEKIMYWYFEEK